MKNIECKWKLYSLILLGSIGVGITSIKPCFAQTNIDIVPDNTLGTEASQINNNLNNPNGIPSTLIEGGAERGQNLFHSLQEFNVNEGRGAYFVVPNDAIQNILTRVTGNNPSSINGILGTILNRNFNPTNANLFLINPNGIIFGRNATLDVNGSFVGTTANAISFGEQGFFSATNPQAPPLLTVDPNGLLFNQINQNAAIQNNSATDVGLNPINLLENSLIRLINFTPKGLRVADGKSLLLVGGDINIDGGGLIALGGQVELGGLTGEGTVGLNGDENNISLNFPDGVARSNVFLSNGARVTVMADNGGSIAVNARNLEMTQESFLVAGIDIGLGSENSQAGNIDVNATGAINLNNSSFIINNIQPEARGQGGDVKIGASTLKLEGGSLINANTRGEGKGGDLTVNAQDVQLIGQNEDGEISSGLFVQANEESTGDAGDLTVNTNELLVQDGAIVSSDTLARGKGGNLTVNAEEIQLIGSEVGSTGLFARSLLESSTGDAGELKVETNSLEVKDGASVSASTFGEGKGGNLTVNAQDIQLIGKNGESLSGLFVQSFSNSLTGDAGNLKVETNSLEVKDGASVSASTFGLGKGGNLTVNAQDEIKLIGSEAGLFTRSFSNSSTGDAGDLKVETNRLEIKDRARVSADTFGQGKAGNLTVEASYIELIGSEADSTGLFARSFSNSSTGDGGNLKVETNSLEIKDGASVSASTFGQGKAGNLTVETTNKLLVQDGATVSADTFGLGKGGNLIVNAQHIQLIGGEAGLFARSFSNSSTGDAGNLKVETNSLEIKDGASVSASTFGQGKGGNLTVNADTLQLKNDGTITAQSTGTGNAGNINIKLKDNFNADDGKVITQSVQSSGGNIEITTEKNIFLRNNSDIKTTLSTTAGSGGNITLNANTIVALEDSDILAFAAEGSGGNIAFNTRAFLSNPLFRPTPQTAERLTEEELERLDDNNRVDVNASGSISSGNISGIPDISFLQNSLTELAQNTIDSEALIATSCVVRSNQANGTFYIIGSQGFPYRPGDAVPSKYSAIEVQSVPNNTSAALPRRRWKMGDPIVEPTGVYRLANGRRILSRECGR